VTAHAARYAASCSWMASRMASRNVRLAFTLGLSLHGRGGTVQRRSCRRATRCHPAEGGRVHGLGRPAVAAPDALARGEVVPAAGGVHELKHARGRHVQLGHDPQAEVPHCRAHLLQAAVGSTEQLFETVTQANARNPWQLCTQE
jgi:hypothetical protein